MNTPICDFVKKYAEDHNVRAHMPGHKGMRFLGAEHLDITEIQGADSLFEADGIIAESEKNAAELFGAHTFFSTEGSSLCIRAMLCLCVKYARTQGKRPLIFAGRNAHKTFLSAVALLDADVRWMTGSCNESYLSCKLSAEDVESYLKAAEELPVAVYLTSPDYTGHMCDIKEIAAVCHRYGVILAVDNAHGAYLKFLSPSLHPIDLGADICCDSAHKTLPCLTGAAYLHVSKNAPSLFCAEAKGALAMFGSTSPSYLILQSLDAANAYSADGYRERLGRFICKLSELKTSLCSYGYRVVGDEPMKLTLSENNIGYKGNEISDRLSNNGIICECSDKDFCVLMLTPENSDGDLERICRVLLSVEKKSCLPCSLPSYTSPVTAMSVREAMLSPCEILPVRSCKGRILAAPSVSCPPAVPILICGEVIDDAAIERFEYYGIKECCVVRD